jgi:hypothetical protein
MICGAPCVILPFFPMAARVRSLRRTTPPFSPRQAISEARAGVNLPLDPQPSLLSPFNHDPFCIPSASSFSPSSTCSMSSKAFLNTITARRSIYQLNRQLPDGVTDASIQELVKEVIKQTPSAVRAFLRRCSRSFLRRRRLPSLALAALAGRARRSSRLHLVPATLATTKSKLTRSLHFVCLPAASSTTRRPARSSSLGTSTRSCGTSYVVNRSRARSRPHDLD